MRSIWMSEYTLTKRHLGLILLAAGLLFVMGMVILELVKRDGFGTVQKLGVAGGIASLLVGLSLLPLGDRPA